MSGFFIIVVVFIVLLIASNAGIGQAPKVYKKLMSSGVQARGILLSVKSIGVRQPGGMRSGGPSLVRFERRDVRVDVEEPGHAPYEIQTSALIPMNLSRDVLPGATVELRVDPGNRGNLAIVGLGIGLPIATTLATGTK